MITNIIVILQVLVAFQCGMLSLFLLTRRRQGRPMSNNALGILLIMLGIQMLTVAAQWLHLVAGGDRFSYLFGYLYGPCFLFYLRGLLHDEARVGIRSALHLLPFVCALVLWEFSELDWKLNMLGTVVSMGSYTTFSFWVLHRYQQLAEGTRSDLDRWALGWLRFILGAWALIFGLYAGLFTGLTAGLVDVYAYLSLGLYTALLIFVAALVFAALECPQLFKRVPTGEVDSVPAPSRRRVEPSDEDRQLAERVSAMMSESKPYLRPELGLSELAAELSMAPRRLSELINDCFQKNFSDFVNSYRIEDAKRRLQDPAVDESILEVMYTAGFNSKSVFNAAFKLKTGFSPSQYRSKHRRGPK